MNKIVPVLMLYLSIATALLCAAALTFSIISCYAPPLIIIAMPMAITGLVCSIVFGALSFLFKKDILCKISFYLDLISLAAAIAAVSVSFSVL